MSFIKDKFTYWSTHPIQNSKESDLFLSDLSQGEVSVIAPNTKDNESLKNLGEVYQENFLFFEFVKKRILECFQYQELKVRDHCSFDRFDFIPGSSFGPRKLPGAIQRQGSFVHSKCIMMPSFTNIGAYVNEGTMIDTWATVGSCAYVGKNVHLSGGVGIGGVLEPAQAKPVIISDDCFIGSRSIIVEGCFIGKGAVIAAGSNLTASTKVFDLTGSKELELNPGVIPDYSVVVPGTREYKYGFHIPCALIIKKRDAKTDLKVSLNDLLRGF